MHKRLSVLTLSWFMICAWLIVPVDVFATETRIVETEGSVGFTGSYQPIGKPEPNPPESIEQPPISDIAKPGGSLPQTNSTNNPWLIVIGGSILWFCLIWVRQQKRKQLSE